MTALRLLLIEDNEDDAQLIVRELRVAGFAVTWERVDTAAALLAALQGAAWDVITCDWVMPQFSAPAALALLRQQQADVPIIIVSGEVGEEVAVTAMKGGAQDFVSKHRLTRLGPVVARELRDAEERRARQTAEARLRDAETQAHAALELQRRELDMLYNRAPCGYHSLDRDGRIVRINDTELGWLGFARAEVVGRSLDAFLAPPDRAAFRRNYPLQVVERGEARDIEVTLLRKDGSLLPALLNTRAITDANGQFLMSNATVVDLTERKHAEKAIRQSERRWRTLIERSLDLIAVVDETGTYRYANPAHEAVYGVRPDELVGQSAFALLHPDDIQALGPQLAEAIAAGVQSATVEYRLWHQDGSWHTFEGIALNLTDDTRVAGVLITGRDVTERTRAAESIRAHAVRLNTLHEIDRAILNTLPAPRPWSAARWTCFDSSRRPPSLSRCCGTTRPVWRGWWPAAPRTPRGGAR